MKKLLKPLLWVLVLVMSVLLVAVFSSGGCKRVEEPVEEEVTDEPEEEVLDESEAEEIVKESVEGIIASGILKLNINENEIYKEYLALCINSIIGKLQIERNGGGSVITHWRPEQIKELQIPILPDRIQQKIALLIQQSYEARRKAEGLVDIAKKSVEIYIEKDEEFGLKYIDKELQKM